MRSSPDHERDKPRLLVHESIDYQGGAPISQLPVSRSSEHWVEAADLTKFLSRHCQIIRDKETGSFRLGVVKPVNDIINKLTGVCVQVVRILIDRSSADDTIRIFGEAQRQRGKPLGRRRAVVINEGKIGVLCLMCPGISLNRRSGIRLSQQFQIYRTGKVGYNFSRRRLEAVIAQTMDIGYGECAVSKPEGLNTPIRTDPVL